MQYFIDKNVYKYICKPYVKYYWLNKFIKKFLIPLYLNTHDFNFGNTGKFNTQSFSSYVHDEKKLFNYFQSLIIHKVCFRYKPTVLHNFISTIFYNPSKGGWALDVIHNYINCYRFIILYCMYQDKLIDKTKFKENISDDKISLKKIIKYASEKFSTEYLTIDIYFASLRFSQKFELSSNVNI
jgi:hypothetical protein